MRIDVEKPESESPIVLVPPAQDVIDAMDFVDEWYKGVQLLGMPFRSISGLCSRSISLTHMISYAPIKMHNDIDSAYTDGVNVFIPYSYFTADFYEVFGYEPEYHKHLAMILFNGSTSHEALHIKLSECDILKACKEYGTPEMEDLVQKSLGFLTCIQIVEDLFIESCGRTFFPKHSKFIDGKNSVVFREHRLLETAETLKTKDDLLELLYFRKNVALDSHKVWLPFAKFCEVLEKSKDIELTKSDRLDIALELYKLIESDEETEGTTDQPIPAGATVIMIDSKLSQELSQELKAEHVNVSEMDVFDKEAIRSEIERNEEHKVFWKSESGAKEVVEYLDVEDYRGRSFYGRFLDNLELIPEWLRFASYFKYFTEMKHVPGKPRNVGNNLLKAQLHRIAIDSKILSFRDADFIKKGKPEVIVLIDLSGSMDYGHSGYVSLAGKVTLAAYGITVSFAEAKMPLAVYGHTTLEDKEGRDHCMVAGISAYAMPMGMNPTLKFLTSKHRFELATRISLNENFDGYAIEFVKHRFTKRPGDKILCVLSDGQPAGPGYYGDYAKNHTRSVVNKARREGIKVVSFSLTESVVEVNNTIYGKDMNVRAYGSSFGNNVQQMIMKLTASGHGTHST